MIQEVARDVDDVVAVRGDRGMLVDHKRLGGGRSGPALDGIGLRVVRANWPA
jgi:hypothetical protein